MEFSLLKKLGLSDKEITIYLKVLEYGSLSVRRLAELTGINRGTAYDVLKTLEEQGLVRYQDRNGRQFFAAEEPEILADLIERRLSDLQDTKEQVVDLIPELRALAGKQDLRPVSKYYEGKEGIHTVLDDILESVPETGEYYVYSTLGVREDIYEAYPEFNMRRVKKNIKVCTISLAPGGDTYGLDDRRWLPVGADGKNLTYILIYADKSAFIARDALGQVVVVVVENEMIYETQKTIFLNLWNVLKA
jgi:sugar-specific transcriptional regulator TrmB